MQVPDDYWEKFADNKLAMRHREPGKENVPHTRAALAMCENIDWNVGRVLKKLDALGIAQDTIVVFFHDNGPNGSRWNGGMKGRKGSTDEGGVRSPLFVRWPGKIDAGKVVRPVGAAIDLLPTLADLAGIKVAAEKPLDGVSLKSLLTGDGEWSSRTIFSHWRGKVSARTDRYRLDHKGQLYDMREDFGQTKNIAEQKIGLATRLRNEVSNFRETVVAEMGEDERAFLIGHPGMKHTQIPARDAVPHGGIKRSNKFPNCSHFTNWDHLDDKITWDVEVVEDGEFDVQVYYTCPKADVGSVVELSLGEASLRAKVTLAFDPPYVGMAADRVRRSEGDEKEWRPMSMGRVKFPKGKGTLTLKAVSMPGGNVMDFRLLMLKRVGG